MFALLFEAASIQGYLFATGRLRDAVAASQSISLLADPVGDDGERSLLDRVLAQVPGADSISFSRRAGGAFYAFCAEPQPLQALADLWSLGIAHAAPGLHYMLAQGQGDTMLAAFDAAHGALRRAGPRPHLPLAPPCARRAPRTGLAAVARQHEDWLDLATATHRTGARRAGHAAVTRYFTPPGVDIRADEWPVDFEPEDAAGAAWAFPFRGEDRTVALIHIDGNGLGQLLRRARAATEAAPEKFLDLFQTLSRGISTATIGAAQQATVQVLLPERDARTQGKPGPLAARPIVLGGDDLTLIIRADLALAFARAFIAAFEASSHEAMAAIAAHGATDLPTHLTAGAGVVFMHASQPFHLAAELAENLTSRAKDPVRHLAAGSTPAPSTILCHRVTGTLGSDFDLILETELTMHAEGMRWRNTVGACSLGTPVPGLPALDDVRALAALLQRDDMARGPSRQLLQLVGESPGMARKRYRRWRRLMRDKAQAQLKEFDALLARLLDGVDLDELPWGPEQDGVRSSPLGDALALAAAGAVPAASASGGQP